MLKNVTLILRNLKIVLVVFSLKYKLPHNTWSLEIYFHEIQNKINGIYIIVVIMRLLKINKLRMHGVIWSIVQ